MNKILLRNKVTGTKKVTYTKKPDLVARKCECCGLVFGMKPYCNDALHPAQLAGTFDRTAFDKDGRGLGNMFEATVCSLTCADKVFKGGWKKLKGYKPYVKEDATLIRVQIGMTSLVQTEEEMIKEWETAQDQEYGQMRYSAIHLANQ